MLTLILLVVLGGGAGLLAVWLIDPTMSQRVGRLDLRSLRARVPRPTARPVALDPDTEDGPARGVDPSSLDPELPLSGTPPAATTTFAPLEVQRVPAGPLRKRRRGDTPKAFTAVEGSWREVGVVPLWRKAASAALLLGLLVATGVGVAAVAAAVLGAAAELVDGAVG